MTEAVLGRRTGARSFSILGAVTFCHLINDLSTSLLVSRRLKFRPGALAAVAIIVVAGHVVDAWWLVMPPLGFAATPVWIDAAALAAVGGLVIAACAWRMRGLLAVPLGDPYLADGLAYESHT